MSTRGGITSKVSVDNVTGRVVGEGREVYIISWSVRISWSCSYPNVNVESRARCWRASVRSSIERHTESVEEVLGKVHLCGKQIYPSGEASGVCCG